MSTNTFNIHIPATRCRAVVKLGAKGAAKQWLLRDERGSWEKRAAELITHAESLKASGDSRAANLSSAQIDAQVADRLTYEALMALQSDAAKRGPKKRKVVR